VAEGWRGLENGAISGEIASASMAMTAGRLCPDQPNAPLEDNDPNNFSPLINGFWIYFR
jgi:hypothetical protein